MLVLQSLRLMDGEDAYATGLVALDGLRTEGLLPLGEEGCKISSVLVDEVDEVVVESADVGTLRGKALEGEDGIEALGEVVEGERTEVAEVGDIVFWQEGIEVGIRQHLGIVAEVVLHHVAVVDLGNGSLRQLVVGMDEQAHGVDEQTDGVGGIEAESLVGDDGHLGHLFHEILGDEGDDGIGTDKDGHLFLGGTGCQQFADGLLEPMEHLCLIILGRQEFYAHKPLVSSVVRYLLHHIGVSSFQLIGLCLVDLLQRQVFEAGGLFEEGVIEGDDATL